MKFCTNCGRELSQETKFCTFCGNSLSIAGASNSSQNPPSGLSPKSQAPDGEPLSSQSQMSKPVMTESEIMSAFKTGNPAPKKRSGAPFIIGLISFVIVGFFVIKQPWNSSIGPSTLKSSEIQARLISKLPKNSAATWELDVANQLIGVPTIDVYLCGTGSAVWIYDSLATAESSIEQGDWIRSNPTLYLGVDSGFTNYGIIFATSGQNADCERSASDALNSTNSFKIISANPATSQPAPTEVPTPIVIQTPSAQPSASSRDTYDQEVDAALSLASQMINDQPYSRKRLIDEVVDAGYSKSVSIQVVDLLGKDWQEQAFSEAGFILITFATNNQGELLAQSELQAQLIDLGFTEAEAIYGANRSEYAVLSHQ